MKKFEIIDHTADLRIKINGETINDIFINGLYGLNSILIEFPEKISKGIEKRIELQSDNTEELLIEWFRELLYLNWDEGFIGASVEIEIIDNRINAVVNGEIYSEDKHGSLTEIKSVTYHNYEINEEGGRFSATITFDV